MSTTPQPPRRAGGTPMSQRLSSRDIALRKGATPIVCTTAYTAPMAGFMDPHVDLLLVGDSMGMVIYGMATTLGVTLDMVIAHGQAVMRGSSKACVVIDLPFGSYQASKVDAFKAAARVMSEVGASAVKLEGGQEMAETIEYLTQRGVPVMAHVGLKPQSVNTVGGFRVQGRNADEARAIMNDAKAVASAGAFSIVVEGTVESLARDITRAVPVPTIGIGASNACDGQVIVTEDILGLYSAFTPKFVKRYAELGLAVSDAVAAYAADVRTRRFPGPDNVYGPGPKATAKKKTRGKKR